MCFCIVIKYLPQYCSITMCLNFAVVFVRHSGVCHLPELLPLSAVWRQARLLIPPPAVQEPLPQTGLLLWLCLRLEHAQICKLYCPIDGIHFILCHLQCQSPHDFLLPRMISIDWKHSEAFLNPDYTKYKLTFLWFQACQLELRSKSLSGKGCILWISNFNISTTVNLKNKYFELSTAWALVNRMLLLTNMYIYSKT